MMAENATINIDAPKSISEKIGQRVDINLGHACMHKCIFCVQGDSTTEQRKWVDREKLFAELEYYARELNVKSLGLLGGEPSIYPWLGETLDRARELGYDDITINTNGYRFDEWEFTRDMVERGLNRFCISIHSESPAVEDFLTGRKGALKSKLTAIRNITHIKKVHPAVRISINSVLNRRNFATMDRYVAFYKQLGIDDIRFNFIRPEGRSLHNPDIVPTYAEVMPKIMETIRRNEDEFKIHMSLGEIPYCVYPSDFFADKRLRMLYIGEYRDRRTHVSTFGNNPGGIADTEGKQRFVWQQLRMDELKQFVSECHSCPWQPVCGGVWKHYIEMYGEAEFKRLLVE